MTTSDTAVHTQPFQAEVSELLHLMVHSVYSETDIFLRELISNASDACDKLRYEAIANPALLGEGDALKIRILPNKAAKKNSLPCGQTAPPYGYLFRPAAAARLAERGGPAVR